MAGKLLDLELEMGDQRFRAGIHRLGASRSPSAEAERMMTVTIVCRSVSCTHSDYAARRLLGVRFVSAGRAARVRTRARITRITVLNSGLPVSLSALYRLSRFRLAVLATWLIPRALATMPSASRTKSASPVSSAAVM